MALAKNSKLKFTIDEIVNKKIQKERKRLVNQKLKYFETTFSASSVSSTAAVDDIFYPSTGTGDQSRASDFSRATRFRVVGRVTANNSGGAASLRMVFFFWNIDDTDYPPISTDVMQSAVDYSDYNFDSLRAKKIAVIKDMQFSVYPSWQPIVNFKIDLAIDKKVSFTGSANTGTGKIYCYLQSNLASNPPTISMDCMTYFEDTM